MHSILSLHLRSVHSFPVCFCPNVCVSLTKLHYSELFRVRSRFYTSIAHLPFYHSKLSSIRFERLAFTNVQCLASRVQSHTYFCNIYSIQSVVVSSCSIVDLSVHIVHVEFFFSSKHLHRNIQDASRAVETTLVIDLAMSNI